MYAYKLQFHSIKKNKTETKLFDNREDFHTTLGLLLGHTYIKDLKAYHYDPFYKRYIEVKI